MDACPFEGYALPKIYRKVRGEGAGALEGKGTAAAPSLGEPAAPVLQRLI